MIKAIAIDGPAGAGKTSTAGRLSELLGIPSLNTGELFRAMALLVLFGDYDVEKLLTQLSGHVLELDFRFDHGRQDGVHAFVNGGMYREILSGALHGDPELDRLASKISADPAARQAAMEAERRAAKGGMVIMEGRDIGSFVLPDAAVKIYLTAALDIRADRRVRQLGKDLAKDFWPVLEDLRQRDIRDTYRKFAPLRPAEDAFKLDNSVLTLEETAQVIAALARSRGVDDQ